MTDEQDDITSDEMFYARQSAEDGRWRLFDCDDESYVCDTMKEMQSFVTGLWRGMACSGHGVDLSCAFFAANGVLLDTMHSAK